jgi:vacuolar-type H+-ATPase subunit I/STV1
MRLY